MRGKLTYLISGSYGGEVDWALPILYYLKQHKGVKIKVLLTRYIFKEEVTRSNATLTALLKENVDFLGDLFPYLPFYLKIILWPLRYILFRRNLISRKLTLLWGMKARGAIAEKIDLAQIKKDFDADVIAGVGHMFDVFKDKKKVIFMEGGGFPLVEIGNQDEFNQIYLNYNYSKNKANTDKCYYGMPKLDIEWRNKLAEELSPLVEQVKAKYRGYNIIVFFERDYKPSMMTRETYEYLVRTAIEVAIKDPKNILLIKAHPRSSLKPKLNCQRVVIVDEYSPVLVMAAKAVISMGTSVILDSIVSNCPCVDYYKFDSNNIIYKPNELGQIENEFRRFKLCDKADCQEELELFVNKVLNQDYINNNNLSNLDLIVKRRGVMKEAAEKIYGLFEKEFN